MLRRVGTLQTHLICFSLGQLQDPSRGPFKTVNVKPRINFGVTCTSAQYARPPVLHGRPSETPHSPGRLSLLRLPPPSPTHRPGRRLKLLRINTPPTCESHCGLWRSGRRPGSSPAAPRASPRWSCFRRPLLAHPAPSSLLRNLLSDARGLFFSPGTSNLGWR